MGQNDQSATTNPQKVALSAYSAEWQKKPDGIPVGTAKTYAEAQKIYNNAVKENNGSVLFTN